VAPRSFVIDGERAIPVGDSLSFDALQARLHLAESRVRKLASETPAIFILFDCLMTVDRVSLLERPLTDEYQAADGDAHLKITFLMD
jgi:ATP-dependent DNA ligase